MIKRMYSMDLSLIFYPTSSTKDFCVDAHVVPCKRKETQILPRVPGPVSDISGVAHDLPMEILCCFASLRRLQALSSIRLS